MNLRPLFLLPLLASVVLAQDDFPGLRAVMTPSEWAHSGLDQLSADQLAIVDSALTRHYDHTVDKAAQAATARALAAAQARAAEAAAQAEAESKGSWLQRFGLSGQSTDWHDLPVLKAQVVGWVSGNRFLLDNGQVWEGIEYIPFKLKGRKIEIDPRPMGNFDLIIDGENTTIRVRRIE